MSDKRYPTRMHEVLGVEAFEQFQIKGVSRHFFLTAAGQICSNEAGMDNNYLIDAVNRGIIRKPRLTHEQVEQLKALVTLGYRWLVEETVREKRKKTLHWWQCQKPYKQYDLQTIQEMCSELGREIGYLDDVVELLERTEVEG